MEERGKGTMKNKDCFKKEGATTLFLFIFVADSDDWEESTLQTKLAMRQIWVKGEAARRRRLEHSCDSSFKSRIT